MGYETRVVAFIDILGFKNSIAKSNSDEKEFKRILTSLTDLKDFFIKPKDHFEIEVDRQLNADTQIIQVSDSLIISRLIQEQGGIFYMLSDCAFAIHLLISNGFLCRGAIKVGNMYHKDTTLFGQAFIDAYLAEESEKLPVVKFNKDLFEIIKSFPGPANKGFEEWEVNYTKKNCKELNDEEYYLDYFTDYDDLVGAGEGTASIHYLKLREIIISGLCLPSRSSAYKKYNWAADQFNLTAKNYQLKLIEKQYVIMAHTFFYIGKLDRNINVADVEELLKENIATQQKQFNTGLGDDDPKNITIIDYAYVEAEPNCYMIYAKWKIEI